jgi:zinc protease
MVITYCGDQDLHAIESLVREMVKSLPDRKKVKKAPAKVKPISGKREHLKFDREQTQIVIGAPAYSLTKKEDIFLKMITTHLSGQSSALFVEVRDRLGLCYSVSPVHVAALEAGCWGIYIGSGHDKTEAAIKAILGIIHDLRVNGIKRADFERIKTMIDGQNLLAIQTNEDYAQYYSIPVLHNLGINFHHQQNQIIRNATYEDFQSFLKKFFNSKWNIVEAGRKN